MTTQPTTQGVTHVTHTQDCPGPRLHRRNGIHHALLSCGACGASAQVPLWRDWTEESS